MSSLPLFDDTPAAAFGAPWVAFFEALGESGWQDLGARAQRVQRRVREDGATYNMHAAGNEAQREWPLELLPNLVPPEEWATLERGVAQRARLLNAVVADVYGERRLLREGLLPPQLVFAHPQYLRAAHGITPPGGVHLHIAAFDLARGPEGRWWLLAQRVQAPSGLGYLLENRLIIGQQLNEPFHALRVQRLAATFQTLLHGLLRVSPEGERSRIVLLTPGPHHETYFEQVFLARYLGITLVEGGDLTVRDRRLYLKTMHGLERVHVLLRRVDDEWLDPLELRADSALGVPGLLQALRAGEVVVANAPGAGFLESPGLAAFWPGVAHALLGEELVLPAATSWWCGEPAVWHAQRARLAEFVVAPTFPHSATTRGFEPVVMADLHASERAEWVARIDADPAAHTLQARVQLGRTPTWLGDAHGGALVPRAAVMRVFALADGQGGWRVLPGAMTRVAAPGEGTRDPWLSMQRGSASADTWVMTHGEVDPTTLLPPPLSASDLQVTHRTVTSRAAENLFWLGRYTERAENSAALARLTLEMLPAANGGLRALLAELVQWHGLAAGLAPTSEAGAGDEAPALATPAALAALSPRVLERAVVQGLPAGGATTSVGFNLRAVRDCAQALRERFAPEHWKLIQEVDDHFEQHLGAVLRAPQPAAADVMAVLARAATHLSAITGAQTDRMTRDDGWRLLSVARQIERLDTLAHALALAFERGQATTEEGFIFVLRLFDSLITYRAQFQARREVPPLLHLLVFDTDNPRSLAWVARTLRDRLRKLARHDAAWAAEVTAGLPAPESWSLQALSTPDEQGRYTALIEALHGCSAAARGLSDAIGRRLFVHVNAADRSVWQ